MQCILSSTELFHIIYHTRFTHSFHYPRPRSTTESLRPTSNPGSTFPISHFPFPISHFTFRNSPRLKAYQYSTSALASSQETHKANLVPKAILWASKVQTPPHGLGSTSEPARQALGLETRPVLNRTSTAPYLPSTAHPLSDSSDSSSSCPN